MKQVIFTQPKPVIEQITYQNLPHQPIIGFVVGNEKGWLQPTKYNSTTYKPLCRDGGVHHGNGWTEGSLNYCLTSLLFERDIYLFANEKELFRWLCE